MYGALLCRDTEATRSGEAHIGVLFLHNQGFSTMCGHATIALGRFLVDTHDTSVFPRRNELEFNPDQQVTTVKIHAPCGVLNVSVPITLDGQKAGRQVSFISTVSFASGSGVQVHIPEEKRWPELEGRDSVTVDVSFGGTYYAMVSARELGFGAGGLLDGPMMDLEGLSRSVRLLKSHLVEDESFRPYFTHPTTPDYSFLYSIMVVDDATGKALDDSEGAETGLCFFADHQIDRSPTGGCVMARMALAYAKGLRKPGQKWTYHSVVSNAFGGEGGFTASIVDEEHVPGMATKGVRVKVAGEAFYTGASQFVAEESDTISKSGFSIKSVTGRAS